MNVSDTLEKHAKHAVETLEENMGAFREGVVKQPISDTTIS